MRAGTGQGRRGGNGSYRDARIVEEMHAIPIEALIKRKLLEPGAHEYWSLDSRRTVAWLAQDGYAQLHFFRDGEQVGEPQRIEFTSSRFRNTMHERVWFAGCSKACQIRCRRLYVHQDEDIAKCRSCHRAIHASCKMKPDERADYLAYKIRRRIDPNADWLKAEHRAFAAANGITVDGSYRVFPPRPKMMTRPVYARLKDKHDRILAGAKLRHPRSWRRPRALTEDESRAADEARFAWNRECLAAEQAEQEANDRRARDELQRFRDEGSAGAIRRQAEADRRTKWPVDPREGPPE